MRWAHRHQTNIAIAHPRPDRAIGNRLLRSLPFAEVSRVRERLQPIELRAGKVLYQPSATLDYVYFPEDAVIASLAEDKEGTAIEAATTGPEGMIGVGAIAGDNKAVFRHMVQVSGGGQRVAFDTFQKMMIEFPIFRGKLIAFSRAFQIQAMQSAACSATHSVRLARWLLMYHDRVAGDAQRGQRVTTLVRNYIAKGVANALQSSRRRGGQNRS